MQTAKYLIWTALGVAAVLLLTSDKARGLRTDLEDKAMDNAKKLRKRLGKMGNSASGTLSELRDILSDEVEGMSDDTRTRLQNIVKGTTKSAGKLKKNLSSEMA